MPSTPSIPLALPPATLVPIPPPTPSTHSLSQRPLQRPPRHLLVWPTRPTCPPPGAALATIVLWHGTWVRSTYLHYLGLPWAPLSSPALAVPVCPQPSPSHPILPQHATRLDVEDSTTPVISLLFAGARLANSNLRPPVVALTRGHPGRARVSSGPGQVYTSSVFSLIYLDLPITSYPPSTSSSSLTTARLFLDILSHPPLPL